MIFMNGIFGYMCVLIFIKWSTCWVPASHFLPGGELDRCADGCGGGGGDDWAAPKANHFYAHPHPWVAIPSCYRRSPVMHGYYWYCSIILCALQSRAW